MKDAFGVDREDISKARFGPMRPGKRAEEIIRVSSGMKNGGSPAKSARESFRAKRRSQIKSRIALKERLGQPVSAFDRI